MGNLNIKGYSSEELQDFVKQFNLPGYRGKQVFSWIYQKKANQWDEMTDLPKDFREKMKENGVNLDCLRLDSKTVADDGTIKYLFELEDGSLVESVYLPEKDRHTVCFSTQVGCGMGCLFCATGQRGLKRNLSAGEIIDQILQISNFSRARINSLVAMGQGEPLANYEALLKAVKILNHPDGVAIGARHITISTCGLVPGILKLAEEPYQVNLAVSLHAADDDLRNYLMPINRRYSIIPLINACKKYLEKTNRRITFEYTLIAGLNDRPEDMKNLIQLLSGMLCHVNLIPFNPIPDSNLKRSDPGTVQKFASTLSDAHIETTIRRERGTVLTAACGQLQGRRLEER